MPPLIQSCADPILTGSRRTGRQRKTKFPDPVSLSIWDPWLPEKNIPKKAEPDPDMEHPAAPDLMRASLSSIRSGYSFKTTSSRSFEKPDAIRANLDEFILFSN